MARRYDFSITTMEYENMRFKWVMLLSVFHFTLHAAIDFDRQQIQQRIQPSGKVRIQEESEKAATQETQVVEKAVVQKPGQAIYDQYCMVCHRDGLAGAPKFQNAADWKPRLAGKTTDDLTASAIKGLNAMPPKGTCGECSDADIKEAIQYMLPKS